MNNIPDQITLEPDFLEIILKAQAEAERLGINRISDILVLKTLIFNSESEMSDFLMRSVPSWNDIRTSVEAEVKAWAEEAVKEPTPLIEADENEDEDDADEEFLHIHFAYDESVGEILSNAPAFSFDMETIDEVAFVISMLEHNSNYIVSFFKAIGMDIIVPQRYFEGIMLENSYYEHINRLSEEAESESDAEEDTADEAIETAENSEENVSNEGTAIVKKKALKIPKKLSSFVKVLEAEKTEVSPILGREKETESLTKVLLKAKKSNAILVGKAGVGKTAIVENLAWLIENGKCAEALKGKTILTLAVNDIVAGTTLRGMAEERFKNVADFLAEVDDVILFIDEIHNVIGAGNSGSDDKLDMANALKPILAREGISVIGATTEEEYNRIFAKDEAFKRRFEKIVVREPKPEEVYPMIKEQVKRLMKHHNVSISKKVIEFIVNVSGCFIFETHNPDRTLDLIDRSMATAVYTGKKTVTTAIVMSNFDANFELYQKMSDEHKLSVAYHEVGHYLVEKFRENFTAHIMAISIIPAEDYMGITVWDRESNLIEWDYNDHLHNIATMLAGRVAEKMYSSKDTSGASDDLRKASEEARRMVLEYGFSSKFSRRNGEKDLDPERTKLLNEEIDRIINAGYRLAEKILKTHEDLLDELAENLAKRGMLMGSDLEKIAKRVESKKFKVKNPEVSN